GLEGIRRARHRLRTEPAAAALRCQGVARVDLDKGIRLPQSGALRGASGIHPQLRAASVGSPESDPGATLLVAGEVGECEVNVQRPDAPARPEVEGRAANVLR